MLRIRELRELLNLSRVELARFLGVSEATVIRWESDGSITEPKGLQAVLINELRQAIMNSDHDEVGRIVRLCGVNHAESLERLLDLARATKRESTPTG